MDWISDFKPHNHKLITLVVLGAITCGKNIYCNQQKGVTLLDERAWVQGGAVYLDSKNLPYESTRVQP